MTLGCLNRMGDGSNLSLCSILVPLLVAEMSKHSQMKSLRAGNAHPACKFASNSAAFSPCTATLDAAPDKFQAGEGKLTQKISRLLCSIEG